MKVILLLIAFFIIGAQSKRHVIWNFMRVSYAEVLGYDSSILSVVFSGAPWQTMSYGLTGVFNLREDMTDDFEVCSNGF